MGLGLMFVGAALLIAGLLVPGLEVLARGVIAVVGAFGRGILTPDGAITTVAGGLGRYIYQEDNGDGGPAISAHFFYPYQLAVDVTGNLYVGEWNTPRVRSARPF